MNRINLDRVDLWKEDVAKSVDYYNSWFLEFAPKAYRDTRAETAGKVATALELSDFLRQITSGVLAAQPHILPILRMATRPPIARDRLIGLSGVNPSLVTSMEKKAIVSARMSTENLEVELNKIAYILNRLIDKDIFPWLEDGRDPTEPEKERAAVIIADRLCGMLADPIIRNAQEQRQLKLLGEFLESKGYTHVKPTKNLTVDLMPAGTYSFRLNLPVIIGNEGKKINIPIDAVIKPKDVSRKPILFEAKSAGDFTNTNKRRKEEAIKYAQLKTTYGADTPFFLFLCGYFDSGYLGYEAAEGIDWIWEHRLSDLEKLGL
jgi:hypothetical protein